MKRFGKYVMVNDIEDMRKEGVIWEEKKEIRIADYGVFNNINKIDFPHCFKAEDPWDYYCCPDFYPCKKEEVINYLKGIIEEAEANIEEINKI